MRPNSSPEQRYASLQRPPKTPLPRSPHDPMTTSPHHGSQSPRVPPPKGRAAVASLPAGVNLPHPGLPAAHPHFLSSSRPLAEWPEAQWSIWFKKKLARQLVDTTTCCPLSISPESLRAPEAGVAALQRDAAQGLVPAD